MEMEAEHYPNGVLESMSTRIVNGAYKHEDLQTDESSMGKGRALTWCSQAAVLSPSALSSLQGLRVGRLWRKLYPDLVHCFFSQSRMDV